MSDRSSKQLFENAAMMPADSDSVTECSSPSTQISYSVSRKLSLETSVVLVSSDNLNTVEESPSSSRSVSVNSTRSVSQSPKATNRRKSAFALFRNQVAGHLPLFWSHGNLCKPAFPTEVEFYTHVQDVLPKIIPYIPKFIDIVQLIHLSAVADALVAQKDDVNNIVAVSADDVDVKIDRNLSPLMESDRWDTLGLNREMKSKITKLDNRYLVLQDLTYGYKKPCIMDLKLGTRQHGINAPPAKIKSKTEKVNKTTSKSLGLRVCGMQVYMPWKNESIFRDKYFGRSLDDERFESTLHSYFHNGVKLRKECIVIIVERLRNLRKIMEQQKSYVFYACSILLIYEGYVSKEDYIEGCQVNGMDSSSCELNDMEHAAPSIKPASIADMRLIDFAHTYPLGEAIKDEDSGALYGLDKLVSMLEKLLQENPVQHA